MIINLRSVTLKLSRRRISWFILQICINYCISRYIKMPLSGGEVVMADLGNLWWCIVISGWSADVSHVDSVSLNSFLLLTLLSHIYIYCCPIFIQIKRFSTLRHTLEICSRLKRNGSDDCSVGQNGLLFLFRSTSVFVSYRLYFKIFYSFKTAQNGIVHELQK